jgi:class 3 adenylate cyclase
VNAGDYGRLRTPFSRWWDHLAWMAARGAVDAVRYQPRHVELLLACGASQPGVPSPLLSWVATTREQPAVVRLTGAPHAVVRAIAAQAAHWLGPTASAIVRWTSGAAAATADRVGAALLERPLRARTHPGLLVPHPHDVAVVAIDMRGFSRLTHALDDTQHVTELIGEYLTVMTTVVERHRGVVFQYTGDGLLALFLPEIAASDAAAMLDRLVRELARELHEEFAAAYTRWRAEWERSGRAASPIGLGIGISFGQATIGYIGPAGKKQFGVIGEPVNLAAFLCSEAPAGTVLVDRGSFTRAGGEPASGTPVRLRSKKRHQRLDAIRVHYGPPRDRWRRRLLSPTTSA